MIFCSCANVSDRVIHEKIDNGCKTVEDLQMELGVSITCQPCKDALQQLIQDYTDSQQK